MPEIGRPAVPNSFSKISIGASEAASGARASAKAASQGELLNKLANNGQDERGVKFVDRKRHNQMGKDEFLKLLTHQLANQDPSSPVDNKKFSAELAQFAQLEQLTNMSAKLEDMGKNAPAESKFYAASFIGKEVTTHGTSISYDGEARSVDIPFFLPKQAEKVTVNLYDKQNALVARIETDALGRGGQVVSWDGLALDKSVANKGDYRVEVKAWDKEYQVFNGETKSSGLVTGVNFENGETVLQIDGKKKVFLRDVENFRLAGQNKVEARPQVALGQYKQQGEIQAQ